MLKRLRLRVLGALAVGFDVLAVLLWVLWVALLLLALLLLMPLVPAHAQGEAACPGPEIAREKPGPTPSLETRFFLELQRLDGVLVRGQILQGCLLNEGFAFEVETGRGPQSWEAPAGEVVGYLPASASGAGEAPRVLLLTDGDGGFELRAGRLVTPLRLRLPLKEEPPELTLEAEDVEFFLLRGVYARLPLPLQARVLQGVIPAFQELRRSRELLVTREGGVLAGELRANLLLETTQGRVLLPPSRLKRLWVRDRDGTARAVRVELRDGRVLEGLLAQEELPVRVLGQSVRVPIATLEEVLFRDKALRFRGGGGRVRFVPE